MAAQAQLPCLAEAPGTTDVLLLFPPWGSLEQPSLAFGLIKAILAREGIGADIEYLNFAFAERLGVALYRSLKDRDVLVSDWIFSEAAFGEFRDRAEFLRFLRQLGYGEDEIASWSQVQQEALPFIEACMQRIDFARYAVVGFTTSMMQTLPALALARRIKARHPSIRIVFGGANCEGEMGVALLDNFPFIDVVVRRDCDAFVAPLFDRLRTGASLEGLPVCHRDGEAVHVAEMPAIFADLDADPYPDYDDYFEQLARTSFRDEIRVNLVFEGSRGCWYGQKTPCTFCAVTGSSMEYRSKSPGRLVDELAWLAERHGVRWFGAADNILDFRGQEALCMAIRERVPDAHLFFDVKANLTRRQVEVLKLAGIDEVQPGIESLSTPVLKLMRKGTTGIRNVHVLRLFAEIGIWPMWNYLYGFPGETADLYDPILDWSEPALFHLPAPYVGFGLSMMRFSAYFERPDSYGIEVTRPLPHYAFIFPLPAEQIARLAYYFEFAYRDGYDPRPVGERVVAFVKAWQRAYYVDKAELVARCDGDAVRIADTRFGKRLDHHLPPAAAGLYRRMERPNRMERLVDELRRNCPPAYLALGGQAGIRHLLAAWEDARLLFREGESVVAIAIPERPAEFWLTGEAGLAPAEHKSARPKPSILHWKVDHIHA